METSKYTLPERAFEKVREILAEGMAEIASCRPKGAEVAEKEYLANAFKAQDALKIFAKDERYSEQEYAKLREEAKYVMRTVWLSLLRSHGLIGQERRGLSGAHPKPLPHENADRRRPFDSDVRSFAPPYAGSRFSSPSAIRVDDGPVFFDAKTAYIRQLEEENARYKKIIFNLQQQLRQSQSISTDFPPQFRQGGRFPGPEPPHSVPLPHEDGQFTNKFAASSHPGRSRSNEASHKSSITRFFDLPQAAFDVVKPILVEAAAKLGRENPKGTVVRESDFLANAHKAQDELRAFAKNERYSEEDYQQLRETAKYVMRVLWNTELQQLGLLWQGRERDAGPAGRRPRDDDRDEDQQSTKRRRAAGHDYSKDFDLSQFFYSPGDAEFFRETPTSSRQSGAFHQQRSSSEHFGGYDADFTDDNFDDA